MHLAGGSAGYIDYHLGEFQVFVFKGPAEGRATGGLRGRHWTPLGGVGRRGQLRIPIAAEVGAEQGVIGPLRAWLRIPAVTETGAERRGTWVR